MEELSLTLAVAALTILYELIWLPGRHALNGALVALGTEAGITFVLWVLWLGELSARSLQYGVPQMSGLFFPLCKVYGGWEWRRVSGW